MEGNKYVHEVPNKAGGPPEKKEVLLDEHDPIWLELCHSHIADASERLHDKMRNFVAKNRAAQIQHGSRDSSGLSTRDLQRMVQALPQYTEQIGKLSLHVEDVSRENRLRLLMVYAAVHPEKFVGEKGPNLMQKLKMRSMSELSLDDIQV